MGKVIAAYRRHPDHGSAVRQADIARWAGTSQVRISRIENGPPMRQMDSLAYWAELLGIPHHLLWFQMPGRTHSMSVPRQAATDSPTASGFRLLRLDARLPAAQRDMAVIESLRSADLRMGGGHLYRELIRYLTTDLGPRLLFGHADPALFVVAAGLIEMSGWMAHDAGHDELAHHQFTRAREFAKLGPDRQLPVHIRTSLSHLELHRGNPKRAIQHAYEAESALAKAPAHPELKARLSAMQARGFAALGEARQTRATLQRAADALDAPTAYPLSPWVSRFDHAVSLPKLRDAPGYSVIVPVPPNTRSGRSTSGHPIGRAPARSLNSCWRQYSPTKGTRSLPARSPTASSRQPPTWHPMSSSGISET
ncbi:hypothetical protein [Nocardia farcinica]|uniref:hypothetical protein n=1 Tax=Nocardia farcinica TaxID=37329 RepID=UPI0024570230|nr:hypothetical protein [Nocardia farcinica]